MKNEGKEQYAVETAAQKSLDLVFAWEDCSFAGDTNGLVLIV